jgi:hypothetical protein
MKDAPLGYSKDNFIKDREALKNGDSTVSFDFSGKAEMLDILGAVGKKYNVFGRFDVCSMAFERMAIIYQGDNVIRLSWVLDDNDEIIKNNPIYFAIDQANCGDQKVWNRENNTFFSDLLAGKTDKLSQDWYWNFDKVLTTFKFTE